LGHGTGASDRLPLALDRIAHRGPDGQGLFRDANVSLGHRRLAIIDLSEGGHQPMLDPASGMIITFNGEIYNYLEVRRELQALGVQFRSDSDTEVLLKAWIQWREDAFRRLNGMWAFAIWDPRRRELVLARDRFGVKPLYWAVVGGDLLFASEPKALLAMAPSLAEPDPQAIYNLIVESRAFEGSRSYLKHVKCLEPASFAIVRPDDPMPVARSFWHYPEPEGEPLSSASSHEDFEALFEDAVRLRLRSDVPVGLTLSGGLDSSAVLAATARLGSPLQALTSVYSESERGEESWAALAAETVGARLHRVAAASDNWAETLEQVVWHMDGPGYTPAVFPLWAIMKWSRANGIPVLLEGQGADELLAGYPQYVARHLLEQVASALRGRGSAADVSATFQGLVKVTPPAWALRWLARMTMAPLADRFGPKRRKLELVGPMTGDCSVQPLPDISTAHDPVRRDLLLDHGTRVLPALLQYGDAISMAHGIETRLPFMDYRLVEWVFRARPPLIVDGRTKEPVRNYLSQRGMQQIAERPDKQGYPTPTRSWLQSGTGNAMLADMLDNGAAPIWSYIDRPAATRMARRGIDGDDIDLYHFYKLLTCHLWLRQLGGQSLPPLTATMPPASSGSGDKAPQLMRRAG